MNLQQYLPAVIGVLVLARVVWAQFTWRPVREGRIWVLPGILLIIGIVTLMQGATAVTALDFELLGLEAVISIGSGLAMGALARFRVADVQADAAPGAPAGRTVKGLESRTGWLGLVLWLVVIGARIGIGFWGHSIGASLVESSGAILLTLALNRGARALLVDLRAGRLRQDLAA